MKITQALLKELLHYDPRTGIWRWVRPRASCLKPGDVAGANSHGYVRIKIYGKQNAAHVLAWIWMTGKRPRKRIDHKNNNPGDNRWKNLRLTTHSQNIAHAKRRRDNTVGFKGVCRRDGKFMAQIQCKGKHYNLGIHETPEAAHAAYITKAQKLFGAFARAA